MLSETISGFVLGSSLPAFGSPVPVITWAHLRKKGNLVQRETQKSFCEFLYRRLNYYLTSVGKLEPIVMKHACGRSLGIMTVI